jgi:hypothetical protein
MHHELSLPSGYSVRPERDDDGFNRYAAFKGIECIDAGALDASEMYEACRKHHLRVVTLRILEAMRNCHYPRHADLLAYARATGKPFSAEDAAEAVGAEQLELALS